MLATTFVQVEVSRLDGLAAAEGKQLAGQVGGSLGSQHGLLGGDLLVFGQVAHLEEGEIALDRREDVVEVVRDPRRQLAERLHLLDLEELLLKALLLRDIPNGLDGADLMALLVEEGGSDGDRMRACPAEQQRQEHLRVERTSLPAEMLITRRVILMLSPHQIDQHRTRHAVERHSVGKVPAPDDVGLVEAGHLLDGAVPSNDFLVPIHHEGAVGKEVNDVQQPLMGGAEFVLRLLPLRDVANDHDHLAVEKGSEAGLVGTRAGLAGRG